jgi:hypothetical protein
MTVEEKGFWVEHLNGKRRVRMTKLYNVWASMRSRCFNEKHHAFARYGARGITVCAEWNDFAAFRAWALSSGYAPGLYLDRENNDEGYAPDNCRWVTSSVSVRNRSQTVLSETLAASIRDATGTHRSIGERFGICREHVRDIKQGKIWRQSV